MTQGGHSFAYNEPQSFKSALVQDQPQDTDQTGLRFAFRPPGGSKCIVPLPPTSALISGQEYAEIHPCYQGTMGRPGQPQLISLP